MSKMNHQIPEDFSYEVATDLASCSRLHLRLTLTTTLAEGETRHNYSINRYDEEVWSGECLAEAIKEYNSL